MSSISEALSGLPSQFVVRETVVTTTVPGQAIAVCAANPLRWGLFINGTFLSTPPSQVGCVASLVQANAASGIGKWFGSGIPDFALNFRDHGIAVQQQWFCAAQSVTQDTSFDVIEILVQQ